MITHSDLWTDLESESSSNLIVLQNIDALIKAAISHYCMNQYEEALSIFRRAYIIAEKIANIERISVAKRFTGHCLIRLGRLRESLVVLLELEQIEQVTSEYYWGGLKDQTEIAILLPLPLAKIEKTIERLNIEMINYNLLKSRSMVLAQEATLFYRRYDFQQYLRKSQEAFSCYEVNANPINSMSSIYYEIINSYIMLKQFDNAKIWLERMRNINDDKNSTDKELNIFEFETLINIIENRKEPAWKYAEMHLLRERETGNRCYKSLILIIQAGILAGKLSEIKKYLIELAKLRNSEVCYDRYEIRLIFGDYCQAVVKAEIEQTSHQFYRPIARYLRLAERYYCWAMELGEEIDTLLCCKGHQVKIKERMDALRNISNLCL